MTVFSASIKYVLKPLNTGEDSYAFVILTRNRNLDKADSLLRSANLSSREGTVWREEKEALRPVGIEPTTSQL